MSSLIFNIQRFSLNDGPGIRTTVFLKGCFLSCEWCHNPESQSFKKQLSYNPEKCIHCFECVKACPDNAHFVVDEKHYLNRNLCSLKGKCTEVCPSDALKLIGAEVNTDTIIREVLKDKKFYEKTGGGITISGGDPMAHFIFTKELLTASKKHWLHTVLDTCGYAGKDQFKQILPYVDLFLFDYKITDSLLHKKYTDVSNEKILSNLDFLYFSGAAIILRCPLIPGINDDPHHLEGIRKLIRKYPGLKGVELMPYHNMGRSKAQFAGMEYKLSSLKNTDESTKSVWLSYFAEEQISVVCN